MSPYVTDVWDCRAWDKAAHCLKLVYAEGGIDFIVSVPAPILPRLPAKSISPISAIEASFGPTPMIFDGSTVGGRHILAHVER
jgi:hypothetical protein